MCRKGVRLRERDAVRSFDFGTVGVQMYGRCRNRTKAKQEETGFPFPLVLLLIPENPLKYAFSGGRAEKQGLILL